VAGNNEGLTAFLFGTRGLTMDLAALAQQVAQAEIHVISVEKYIADQRELVEELEHDGEDATKAKAVLAKFEEARRLHVENRDHLRMKCYAALLSPPAHRD
jgi:hypothetical protein